MSHEIQGWGRYAVVFGGMLIAGAICTAAMPFLMASTGTFGPTALQAQSVLGASAATTIFFGLAVGVACIVGRWVNTVVGLFVLGAGLWALRLRTGTAADLAFADGSLGLVALETVLWGGLVLAATFVVFRVAGPLKDISEPDSGHDQWWDRLGLRGVAAGILVLPVVWVFARSPMQSQTLVAVVLGGLVVGLVGRLLSPHAQPRLLFAVPCFFGALGQLIAMFMMHDPLVDALVADNLPALSLPMPIDYAAGSLMGVAMGLGWAKGFLHLEE